MKYIYTHEELPQKSEKWLELRSPRVGGSDVPTILGLNKYEKPHTAWKRKTGRLKPKKMNEAMARGAAMEDEAIDNVLEKLKIDGVTSGGVVPIVAIHPEYDNVIVSFDGVDVDNKFIVEVKCPKFSWNFKSIFTDGIPEHYYPQVQLQLFVANAHWGITKAYFGSYFPDGAYITDYIAFKDNLETLVVIDEDYDEKYCHSMLSVIDKFLDNVKYDHWDEEEYKEVVERFNKETKG